jgi:hypothetical protein
VAACDVTEEGRIVGGLMFQVGDKLLPTSGRLEMRLAPVCWRCAGALWPTEMHLVPGEEPHGYVWVCAGCVSSDDRTEMSEAESA